MDTSGPSDAPSVDPVAVAVADRVHSTWVAAVGLLLSACSTAKSPSPRPSHPAAHSTSGACSLDPAPSADALWPAIPAADRAWFRSATPRIFSAELDGAPPSEAVLAVDHVGDRSPDDDRAWAAVYVLHRKESTWTLAGQEQVQASLAWDGFYEGPPGLVGVGAERILGACHDALRVERLDMQGGVDPRYRVHSYELYALEAGALVRVFDCFVESDRVTGPARAGRTENSTIRFDPTSLPARIHVDVRSTWDPGVEEDESPTDGRSASESRSADYHFDGRRYGSTNDVCGGW